MAVDRPPVPSVRLVATSQPLSRFDEVRQRAQRRSTLEELFHVLSFESGNVTKASAIMGTIDARVEPNRLVAEEAASILESTIRNLTECLAEVRKL